MAGDDRTPWESVDPDITHGLVVALLMKLDSPILITEEDAIATHGKGLRMETMDDRTIVLELVAEDEAT
jgi:hypothetical protein